jgi:hypothetical protein
MTHIRVVWDACKVQKTVFVQVFSKDSSGYRNPVEFFLQHCKTTILRGYYDIDNKPIVMDILADSRTQLHNMAINQVLEYLHIEKTPAQIEKEIRKYRRRIALEVPNNK